MKKQIKYISAGMLAGMLFTSPAFGPTVLVVF